MQVRQKLGAPGRHQLRELESAQGGKSQLVSLLLRGQADFSADQIARLEQDGAHIRTSAGDILSLDVAADAVDRLLAHDFIVAGEVSAPLYPETEDAPYLDLSG